MTLTVKLIGPLIQALGFSEKPIYFAGVPTPDAVLKTIAFPADRPRIITRNGRAVRPDESLAEGDRIVISPLYSGG
jgi:molybdopterin converting factor small subunit